MNPCPQRASPAHKLRGHEAREVIVEGIALGKTTKELAALLGVSQKCIGYHVSRIYSTLTASEANTAGLVRMAIRYGMVKMNTDQFTTLLAQKAAVLLCAMEEARVTEFRKERDALGRMVTQCFGGSLK